MHYFCFYFIILKIMQYCLYSMPKKKPKSKLSKIWNKWFEYIKKSNALKFKCYGLVVGIPYMYIFVIRILTYMYWRLFFYFFLEPCNTSCIKYELSNQRKEKGTYIVFGNYVSPSNEGRHKCFSLIFSSASSQWSLSGP